MTKLVAELVAELVAFAGKHLFGVGQQFVGNCIRVDFVAAIGNGGAHGFNLGGINIWAFARLLHGLRQVRDSNGGTLDAAGLDAGRGRALARLADATAGTSYPGV